MLQTQNLIHIPKATPHITWEADQMPATSKQPLASPTKSFGTFSLPPNFPPDSIEAARRAHTQRIKMETVSGEETKDRISEIQHIPLLPLMKASPYLFFTKVWKIKES
jgi:hypothetical protein